MLNVIWLLMILVAVLVGGFTGKLGVMTEGAFAQAKAAVMEIALPLIGLMAIWLGMMRLAERAGLVQFLARCLRPVLRVLFPEVPAGHPAQGAMVLNMAANMLGLGNAATPLGIRAMALLQRLNPHKAIASNSMVTFLAVNTASIQLVPMTAISLLAVQGGKLSSSIIFPALLATAVAMASGIAVSRFFARFFPIRPEEARGEEGTVTEEKEEPLPEFAEPPALTVGGRVLLAGFFLAIAGMFFVLVWPDLANALPVSLHFEWRYANFWPHDGLGLRMVNAASVLAVPFMLAFFPGYAWLRGVKVYEQFCEGAKEAFATGQRIVPFLVAMLVSIRLLREAGVIQAVTEVLRGGLARVGFPADLLPLAIMRPLSGGASQGILVDLIKTHGPDSVLARMAGTIYGSTETTFYVLAIYFGSVGIRKYRHAILVGLTADLVALAMAIWMCKLFLR
jgi:spore maturation protein SpmA